MRLVRRLLAEPLLHFVLLGSGLFTAHRLLQPSRRDELRAIVITSGFVEALRRSHERRLGHAPSAAELRALVDEFVREEALYRAARARGLDRGDLIVRRRLVQKMEFLLRSSADVAEPADAALSAWLQAHPERFREPPRTSFSQVFFSRDRRHERAREDASALLAELGSGAPPLVPGRGDPFLLGTDFVARSDRDVAGAFGPAFAAALRSAPDGRWSGPLESSYGWHLVRVSERVAGRVPPLRDVRARVLREVLTERRDAALERDVRRVVATFRVERAR